MNERELSKGKDEFFYKNEILTKWCVDRNFKVHECHRDRVFFFQARKQWNLLLGKELYLNSDQTNNDASTSFK